MVSRGGKPNTDYVCTLGDDVLSAAGLVRTTPALELPAHPGIFCAGDILDTKERNGIGKGRRQAKVVIANVLSFLAGMDVRRTYGGSTETLRLTMGRVRVFSLASLCNVLTVGQTGGVGYIGILWGIITYNWFI